MDRDDAQSPRTASGVGVLDKSVDLLLALENGPKTIAELVTLTGIPKPTAHRLIVALEHHRLVRRDSAGRVAVGLGAISLAAAATAALPIAAIARPFLAELCGQTGESAQLYVREGDTRVCVAAVETPAELRTIVPEGTRLPLGIGSAGRVLAGEAAPDGWIATLAERAAGVGSVSAPVRSRSGEVVAAVSISGPADRMGDAPGERWGPVVAAVGRQISESLG